MQLHTLKKHSNSREKVRIGRGGKRGSFSGRGIKGQKARAGRRIRPELRDLIKKIPKKRGYRYTGPKDFSVVLKSALVAKHFAQGEHVNPKTLIAKKLVRPFGGKIPKIKIVGSKKVLEGRTITGCALSGEQK